MQLIGRNMSPFVRRTSIVLKLLGLDYEQVELSTADDTDKIAKINPVIRVPSMVLDDGETLVDSNAIIDHLLEVGDPEHRLLPASGAERRAVLRLAAIGHGVMEKGVSSSYERNRSNGDYLCGDHLTLADVNAVVAHDFVSMAEPYLMKNDPYPALSALAKRCGEQAVFADTVFKPG